MLINKKDKQLLDFQVCKTEASYRLKKLNILVIETRKDCTKDFIKKYFNKIFDGKLMSVKSSTIKAKNVTFKGRPGCTSAKKKFFLRFSEAKDFNVYFK